MARFVSGQKIIKARGEHSIGLRAKVIGYTHGLTADLEVQLEDSAINSICQYFVPGEKCYTMSELWEPILDQHTPCETEFKESLDRLCEDLETENAR
jgi:hypothetical protein